MYRCSSRSTAGMNNRYSSKEYVLASFMKGQKHAVIPMTSININPINTDRAEIKICGDTTPLKIIAKGSKAQMNMNKTKFARETGSEEIDLGQFVDDEEEEEKENDVYDNFDIPTSFVQTSPILQTLTNSKENSTDKPSESYSSIKSSITYTPKDKPNIDFDTLYNKSSTSKKRHHDFDSSLDGSDDNDEDEAPRIVSNKRADINDSSKMLNKLLNRKKAPAKKKKKTTIIDDSTDVECKDCSVLREQLNAVVKRLERVERVIPAVKQYYNQKEIGLETTTPTTTTTSLPKIEQINQSIKEFFGVEASQVKGPRERPTIIIRNLFTISNHVTDYREYIQKHADLLKDFVQYRCPGIFNINETWHEILRSMSSLANDIKKNTKTKLTRQIAIALNNQQQQPITTISESNMTMTPVDNDQSEVII